MAPRQRLSSRSVSEDPSGPSSSSKTDTEPIVMSSSSDQNPQCSNGNGHVQAAAASASASASAGGTNGSRQRSDSYDVDVTDRDRHDIFNLISLPIMLGAISLNWDLGVLVRGGSLEESWTNNYLYQCLFVVDLYFILDLAWVAIVPTCVKSPGTIIKHHIVALIYLIAPFMMPRYVCFMGVILSVELNTWFLIARRVLFLRKRVVPTMLRDFVDYAFYASWLAIRVVVYNWLLSRFCFLFYERVMNGETLLLPSLFMVTQTALNLMNLKWTYDLFMPMIKRMLRPHLLSTKSIKEHTL